MIRAYHYLFMLTLFLVTSAITSAQVLTGTPKFGSFGGSVDKIDLANLNAHYDFPVFHKPGRGLAFNFDLSADTSFWQPVTSGSTTSWQPASGWGFGGSALNVGSLGYLETYDSQYLYYCFFSYYDGFGTLHAFSGCAVYDYINGIDYPLSTIAADSSGYSFKADACGLVQSGSCYLTAQLTSVEGNYIFPQNFTPLNPATQPGSVEDRNGNEVTGTTTGTSPNYTTIYTDTLGTSALTITGGNPSPYKLTYTSPGGMATTVTATFKTYTVKTNFGCTSPTITDYPATSVSLVDRITLPDGTFYQFGYEPTPGFSGDVTGRIASVTLPTGGTISYQYTGSHNGIVCADGSAAGLTRTTPDGSWTYSRAIGSGAASTTTVVDPLGDNTVIQFQGIYETQRQTYQGAISSSNLLQSSNTCYNNSASPCTATAISLPITQIAKISQLGSSGVQTKHVDFYNTYGMPTESDDYDFGASGPGALLRKTTYGYPNLGTIKAFASVVTVYNGSGTQLSQTTLNYDETTPVATSGLPQHVSVGTASRGNLTSVQRWLNTTGTQLTTHMTYFDTGMLNTSKDPNGNTTTYTYSSTYADAYLTQLSNALGQNTTDTYDVNTGVLLSTKDANNQTTSFSYDNMLRLTQASYPDGGQSTLAYNVSPLPINLTETDKINASLNGVSNTVFDGLGRVKQTQVTSDPEGATSTDTTYDALGRVASVSNPHRSGASPTDGVTSYIYDALGRTCVTIPPDGTAVSGSTCPSTAPSNDIFATYSNNTVTVKDQAGKARKAVIDGLGRTSQVFEDPSGVNFETDYGYDALSNLLSATQKGGSTSSNWRSRTFTYDSLSRLTKAVNPESGTITYSYDSNGNLLTKTAPAPNQTGTATVVTSYAYDALNRLTQKSYTGGTISTPTATYTYDASTVDGYTVINPIGHRVKAATGGTYPTVNYYSYDPMGRIAIQGLCTYVNCGTYTWFVGNSYDLVGDLTSYTDANGNTFTQKFDSAGRPTQLTSSWSDSNHPATLYTVDPSAGYTPTGAVQKATFGNGLVETYRYNNRLQGCHIILNTAGTIPTDCTTQNSGNLLDFTYGFNSGSGNNGNVLSWNAAGQQTFARSYSYDSLNRLATYSDSASAQACKGLSWAVDAWGNLLTQNVTAGTCYALQQSVNTNNQITGAAYDAAGNLMNDAQHAYTYDAENRIYYVDSGNTAIYGYNADGQRVGKGVVGNGAYYIYGSDGQVVADTDGYGHWNETYIHFGGRVIGIYRGGATGFLHQDHLGSTRLETLYPWVSPSQSVYDNMDFLPYGTQIAGGTGITHKFTGYERDSETGLDYASARHFSSSLIRFMVPDPSGLGAVSLTNPQSLNQYAYVGNNPLNTVDPTGLCDDSDPSSCGGDNGGDWGGPDWGGGGGGVNYGGPIWTEQLPIWTGPQIDPRLIIQNYTNGPNGPIGDDGEVVCVVRVGAVCSAYAYWNADTQQWQGNSPKDPGRKDWLNNAISPGVKATHPDDWRLWGPLDEVGQIATSFDNCIRRPSTLIAPVGAGVVVGVSSTNVGGITGKVAGGVIGGLIGAGLGCVGKTADQVAGF